MVMVLSRRLGQDAMSNQAGDGTAESCWRWRYRGDLAVAQCHCRVILAMTLPSYAGDCAVEVTWLLYDVEAKSCWLWRCRGDLAVARCQCHVMVAMELQLKVVPVVVRSRNP
jgi:hypothetical protein